MAKGRGGEPSHLASIAEEPESPDGRGERLVQSLTTEPMEPIEELPETTLSVARVEGAEAAQKTVEETGHGEEAAKKEEGEEKTKEKPVRSDPKPPSVLWATVSEEEEDYGHELELASPLNLATVCWADVAKKILPVHKAPSSVYRAVGVPVVSKVVVEASPKKAHRGRRGGRSPEAIARRRRRAADRAKLRKTTVGQCVLAGYTGP